VKQLSKFQSRLLLSRELFFVYVESNLMQPEMSSMTRIVGQCGVDRSFTRNDLIWLIIRHINFLPSSSKTFCLALTRTFENVLITLLGLEPRVSKQL